MKKVVWGALVFWVTILVSAPVWLQGVSRLIQIEDSTRIAPSQGRFISLPRGTKEEHLFVQEAGPADGPVVVFLHGTGSWSELWRPTMERLAQRGYHGIAIDLPPFGFSWSDDPAGIAYDRNAQADRVLAVLDALHVGQFSLAGHSFGGMATMTVALKARARIERILLVNVALGFGDEPGMRPHAPGSLTRFIFEHPILRETLTAIGTHPWMTRSFVSKFVRSPDCLTPPVLAMYQAPLHVRDKTAMMGAWLADFLLASDSQLITDLSAYQAIRAPVRIIWGELDPVTPLWQAREIQKWFQEATIATIPGISHIPMIEDQGSYFKELDRVFP